MLRLKVVRLRLMNYHFFGDLIIGGEIDKSAKVKPADMVAKQKRAMKDGKRQFRRHE